MAECNCRPGDLLADCPLYKAASDDGCHASSVDEHNPATNPLCDFAPGVTIGGDPR